METKQHRSSLSREVLIGLGFFFILAAPLQAQYTADFQTNNISNVTSNWMGDYYVGSNTFADVLLMQDSGVLSNGSGYLGYEVSSSNDSVLVAGSGSAWSNSSTLYVGYNGKGNSLVISNGGQVANTYGSVGSKSSSSNNSVLVTDANSFWNNSGDLSIGRVGNRLVVTNGGGVVNSIGYVGGTTGTNDSVLISGAGSAWTNRNELYVGYGGVSNCLVISEGGQVFDTDGYISYLGVFSGPSSKSASNSVLVTGSNSIWSSRYDLHVGEYGRGNGLVISNGGRVLDGKGYIGGTNNSVLITGLGSVWSNGGNDVVVSLSGVSNNLAVNNGGRLDGGHLDATGSLTVGYSGAGNSLVISNGGQVFNQSGFVGGFWFSISSNNTALVTGSGSVWSNRSDLNVGHAGGGNSLLISSSGTVYSAGGVIGWGMDTGASSNSVVVTGSGSVWRNTNSLYVGYFGSGNSLVISNGGLVGGVGYSGRSSYLGYSSSDNNVVITGTGSSWHIPGDLYCGYSGAGNTIVVNDGARVVGPGLGFVGYNSGSGNNRILVTDSGSVWSNSGARYVGYSGTGNSLVISNGAQVIDNVASDAAGCFLGYNNVSGANSVLVTGSNSLWSVRTNLYVGYLGHNSTLIISNSAQVINGDGYVGYQALNNQVRVADGGVWQNNAVYIGYRGHNNSLAVAGGSVLAVSLTIGFNSSTCDNWVQLDSGSVIVTNATHDAVLEVRNGSFIQNGGVVQADILVVTNACGSFVRNGGTLLYNQLMLDPNLSAVVDGIPNGWKQQYGLDPFDPNLGSEDADGDGGSNLQEFQTGTDPTNSASTFRIIDIAQEGDDVRVTWTMGSGKTNALQSSAGDSGLYTTNIADIFIVTNTVGTVTNYLDMGGATNAPSRFYRVRLVP